MLSLTCFNRSFTPSWKMSVLTLFAVLLFITLGFWQLHRFSEKKGMLGAYHQYHSKTPSILLIENKKPNPYEALKITGQYLPFTFLLDNQIYQHQVGYNVLSPFLLKNGNVVLIDRGWVRAPINRNHLPMIKTPTQNITLNGYAYYPSGKNWLLGKVVEKKQEDMAVIEFIDLKLITQFLHKFTYPFIIRLNQNEPNGYIREWSITSISPERHRGYAFQWFCFGFVTLILFVALNVKRVDEKPSL